MSNKPIFNKILLIEDDKSHAFLISRALAGYCEGLLQAETLSIGKELASKGEIDLVITDLNLPDSSKALSVKSIKEIIGEIPVIALTSSNLIQDAVEAMKHGASDFIVKEFGTDFADILGLALHRVFAAGEVRQEREKLRAQMQALRTAIENGSDAMAVVNSDLKLAYYNKAFSNFVAICGGNTDSLMDIFNGQMPNAETTKASLKSKFESLPVGSAWVTELSAGTKEATLTFELNLSIVSGAVGREAVLWIKDISNLKRREKFQRDMLATTTHDLKNPLSAISVSAELLTSLVQDGTKAKDLVLRVGSSAQSAINLIDEFLSARRIRDGSFILKPTDSSPVAAVEEELGHFDAALAARNIKLVKDFKDAPATWRLDSMGIKRVVTNLLSNAVKFTPKGGTVELLVKQSGKELQIGVKDSGCGMEPSEVQKIFDKFSRLDKHADVAGSGIGLFVVKSIVGAHGGRIDVTSQIGQGTSFDVILPENPPVNERGELISLDFTA